MHSRRRAANTCGRSALLAGLGFNDALESRVSAVVARGHFWRARHACDTFGPSALPTGLGANDATASGSSTFFALGQC